MIEVEPTEPHHHGLFRTSEAPEVGTENVNVGPSVGVVIRFHRRRMPKRELKSTSGNSLVPVGRSDGLR